MKEHLFNYSWQLSDNYKTEGIEKNNLKVFSCFACGGGSTMGYKLAGYDVIGMNEIDKKIAEVYIENHKPKYSYIESIRSFKDRDDLLEELYNLDILDSSPPCSTFSMAGQREQNWGKAKKFKEGQEEQILDTLFFDTIDLVDKLKPKVAVFENVKGILLGNAKDYVCKIKENLEKINYHVEYFLLDASKMGVPQKREHVFFIAVRKDIFQFCKVENALFGESLNIDMIFNEKEIILKSFCNSLPKRKTQNYLEKRFGDILLNLEKIAPTITTKNRFWVTKDSLIDEKTLSIMGTFPLDFNFKKILPIYIIGMSVPPIMMAQIALRLKYYIFDKIINKH